MADPAVFADFHHVERADQIGVDIGARVLQAVAHARLRGEMDDDVRLVRGDALPARPPSSSIATSADESAWSAPGARARAPASAPTS